MARYEPLGSRARRNQIPRQTNFWRHMANSWTQARRARQATVIRNWRPWERSTGPKTDTGKARVSRNAWKGGHRPQWRALVRLLNAELGSQLVSSQLD